MEGDFLLGVISQVGILPLHYSGTYFLILYNVFLLEISRHFRYRKMREEKEEEKIVKGQIAQE